MKSFFLCALVLGVLTVAGRPDSPDIMDISRDLIYATPDGIPLTLDVYVPKNAVKPPPVVMWIHGGAWQTGSKDRGPQLPLTNAGLAYVSINYRLSQQAPFPAQIEDCKAAVRWVRAHAAEYHFNADKIGVVGASAGGHLAALLGTTNGDPKLEGDEGTTGVSSSVQAVVDYFGPSDLPAFDKIATPEQMAKLDNPIAQLLGGPLSSKGDLARLASPVLHVSAQACPFLILHGDQDAIVPLSQSVELNAALQKAGVSSRLIIVKGKGHGFHDPVSAVTVLQFLRQQLGAS